MANIKIRVQDTIIEMEENERYFIEVKDKSFTGSILENMNFEFGGRVFFYILIDAENEDYQLAEDEIITIKKL
ncbi:hypothetical protein [Metabacillus indicus]|uniref:hypothetical protein n=1 Tax=Metabacillus indicus TaxID=246786 RepID=UPI0004DCED54|nr:hypothetical protein [Metabacillus indicus]KEZ50537.1 hypothetical protein AZ46_0207665 [Metabacillus indicus LMG 22858]